MILREREKLGTEKKKSPGRYKFENIWLENFNLSWKVLSCSFLLPFG